MSVSTLDAFLASHALARGDTGREVAALVMALAGAARSIRNLISQAASALGAASDLQGRSGQVQRSLDLNADETFLGAARLAGVRHYCSEELASAVDLNGTAALALAIDPLDGSSHMAANVPIGTIFSILPAKESDPAESFLQPGSAQIGAGFIIYGPQLALVLNIGAGTSAFVYSSRLGTFLETARPAIPERTQEFAIDAANYRHWDEAVRLYVDDCLKGAAGPREKDFGMRWTGSLVAEAYRILVGGGVFLSPADDRRGHAQGRLRLITEANPIAMLVEGAAGTATDGAARILDLAPSSLGQRTPLVFGSSREVARIGRYLSEPSVIADRAPLFGHRGLFRA